MSHKNFIFFDPETNAIIGTISIPEHMSDSKIASPHKVNMSGLTFDDNIRYDPKENKIYSV